MPQAMDLSLATPMIRPRLPLISPVAIASLPTREALGVRERPRRFKATGAGARRDRRPRWSFHADGHPTALALRSSTPPRGDRRMAQLGAELDAERLGQPAVDLEHVAARCRRPRPASRPAAAPGS